MRITIINQFYVPDISPTAQLSASLAEGLAARGHEVTVVASRGGYVAAPTDAARDSENSRIYRIWTPQLGKSSILKRCLDYLAFYSLAKWRMIFLRRQDVVIALTTPPYIAWTGVVHRWFHWGRPRPKLVLWNMDCYPEAAEKAGVFKKGSLLSRVMRLGNHALFRRLAHLVVLDTAMRDLLMSQYAPRRPAGKELPVTIIPNWEKLGFFPNPEGAHLPPPWQESEPLGLHGKFVVLYLGNMGVGHTFETVIEAAKRLQAIDKDVRFLFVGGGKRYQWLDEARKATGLENLVMHPYVHKDAIRSVMGLASVALITLSEEMAGVMSPSKLHSNLAMKLPVVYVGPRQSNVDEAIERFGCGVSLREGDVDGLVKFILENKNDPEKLRRLRETAREAFEAAYCDEKTLPLFEAVLAKVTQPS